MLDELVNEVNGEVGGHVDFDGFLKVRHLIKKREGFAARELDHFDRENTGFISQEEFANALAWLGFPDSFAEMKGRMASSARTNSSGASRKCTPMRRHWWKSSLRAATPLAEGLMWWQGAGQPPTKPNRVFASHKG